MALGQLGPPELSKLLYEAHLLKLNYQTLRQVMATPASEMSETLYQFVLEKCGTLNLKIENIGCTGYTDKMNYRIKNSSGAWQPWSQDYMGCYYAPATGIILTKGTIKLQWTVQKTGYSYADSVTLNISPNTATLFHLQY